MAAEAVWEGEAPVSGGRASGRHQVASAWAASSQGPSFRDSCICRTITGAGGEQCLKAGGLRVVATRPAHTSGGCSHADTSRSSDRHLMRGRQDAARVGNQAIRGYGESGPLTCPACRPCHPPVRARPRPRIGGATMILPAMACAWRHRAGTRSTKIFWS